MEKSKKNQKNLLTRAEAKKILGGKENPNDPTGCPEGTHEYICHWGTNWRIYCVANALTDPSCDDPYPGWTPEPGVGFPGPV